MSELYKFLEGLKNPKPASNVNDGKSGYGQAENTISPLVLDLDNDGIELTSLQNSSAFFDLDADGFAEQTGWVKPDDGILALDRNNNGRIDDIAELFGNATTDGFIILKQLDSNNDNVINNQDTQFANLRIWKDQDGDGFSDTGELQSLATWGIQSINLNYQTVDLTNEGNRISSTSTYTRTDGTTRQIVDVWFALDQMNTIYSKDYQLKSETLFLPTLRGYGELPDLYIAMSKTPTLLGMMRNLAALDTSNYEQFHTQFLTQTEALLYRWAGVQNVSTTSRGPYFDGRKLAFLEKFFGEDYYQIGGGVLGGPTPADPGPQASNVLKEVWDSLFQGMVGRLLVQGPMRSLFPDTSFNLSQDSLESNTSLTTTLNGLVANSPTSSDQSILYWNFAVTTLDTFENRFGLSQEEFDAQIDQALANVGFSGFLTELRQPDFLTALADVTFGTAANDILTGTTENNRINGGTGDDTISGIAGDDILDGALGNDIINGGDGNDLIRAGLGTDTIDGGNGRDTLELNLAGQTTDLTITNPANSTSFPGIASMTNIEVLKLILGSGNDQITQAGIINGAVFRSDDIFNGSAGNDVIDAGLGLNDQVDGGSGVDTLVLNYGVNDVGSEIQFLLAGSTANGISGSAGRWTANGSAWLDSISFSEIDRFNITATRKNDTVTTWTGNDTINGGAGDDTLDGGGGDDTINAGAGNDRIFAGSGNDTVNGGSGIDTLVLDLSNQTNNLNFNFGTANASPGIITAANIEKLDITTGSGNDTVTQAGLVSGTVIRGNDTINTGAGNDSINAGLGDYDAVDGGTGSDLLTIDYSAGDTGTGMSFGSSNGSGSALRYVSATDFNYLDFVYFSNIERFNITGTSKDDNITTGTGSDTINAGAGDDTVDGGGGNDTLDGGVGIDKLTLDLSTQTTALNLTNYRSAGINITGVVNATNFENFDIRTGSGNDTVTQAGEVNGVVIRGNDSISTGAGNDTINAGLGDNDSVDGSTGDDLLILDYSKGDTDGGLFFSAGSGFGSAIRLAVGGGVALDGGIFYNIERFNITGTSKDDNIYSGSGNDTIGTGAGNDTIDAGAGDDTVNAGAGDDTVNGGGGNDTLDGGIGIDKLTLDLSTQTTALNLTNYRSAGINIIGVVNATNFEEFDITTGSGNDRVTQAGEVNGVVIRGNDSISTGAGNDTINAGLGDNDSVDGGTGNDLLILDYSKGDTDGGLSFNAGVGIGSAVRLSTPGGIALDSAIFYNIERFNITGTSKDDNIYSGSGNDTINAGAGDDTVNGGGGNDTLDGGVGIDKLTLDLSTQTTALNLTNYRSAGINIIGVVNATNFETFDITTGSGNDTVTQAGLVSGTVIRGNDNISTGAGNDNINAGLGNNDVVDGGTGSDLLTIDYSVGDTGVGMYFYSGNGSGYTYRYVSATDLNYLDYVYFYNIERFNITGTSKDDTITTGTGNDTINAGAGNDTVDAGGGNDTVRGSGGNDIINGGAGNDTLIGDTGNDRLTGGTGADRFTFNAPTEGIDRITDFNISQADLIVVSAAGFGGGLTAGASITADQLVLGTAAADASDRFIYDSATGALRFDVDGTGATAAVQIATLGNKPILSNTSITVIA